MENIFISWVRVIVFAYVTGTFIIVLSVTYETGLLKTLKPVNTMLGTGSGASTYTWNPGALSGTTVAVTPTSTTVYTVVGTTTLGCTATNTVNLI